MFKIISLAYMEDKVSQSRNRILTVMLSLSLILIFLPGMINAQNILKVPFKLERDKIIIPTSVNGSKPQKLILDTGMRFDGVYLFHKNALSLIDTTGSIEVKVPGAGVGEPSTATMIETGHIEFGEARVDSQRIIVSHSEHTQAFPTDGVIGLNFFCHYIVEIDYDNEMIYLHDTAYVSSDTSWQVVPIELIKDMVYLDVEMEVVSGEVFPMKVYIDLASSEAVEMMVHKNQRFTMPDSLEESNLGTGLSGDINGHYGQSRRIRFGGYDLYDIPTAFAPEEVRSKLGGADGILGNDLIRRFNVIFDYPHQRLLIKPNKTFNQPF
jgi:hypothetical protein